MPNKFLISTPSGKVIDLFDLKTSDITFEDLIIGATRIFRFNGNTSVPCTIARHSLAMAKYSSNERSFLYSLLHDLHEIYIGDLIYPLKQNLFEKEYSSLKEIEKSVDDKIFKFFKFIPSDEVKAEVAELDFVSGFIETKVLTSIGERLEEGDERQIKFENLVKNSVFPWREKVNDIVDYWELFNKENKNKSYDEIMKKDMVEFTTELLRHMVPF